jgi:hypothetical protein
MRVYTAELYKTFCDLTVDGYCNGQPDAPRCKGEQFRINSPASYVDIFQRQQAHPVEGSWLPDGGIIPCASSNASYSGHSECPQGFAPYSGTKTEDLCVFPCVTFLYTRAQIDSQFSAYIATGLVGMVANFSLIALDATSRIYEWAQKRRGKRKKGWSTLPTFVVVCAVLGFLFGVIDTIPAAILKFNLPCSEDCIDEFCHGSGLACKVAQPSEYLLLLVFCVLLGVLMELYMKAVINSPAPRVRHVKRCYRMVVFAMMFVVVLTCVFADSDVLASGSDENRQLIVSRDIFSCGPRFSSSVQELVFLTLPFMFVCLTLVGFTFGMIHRIWVMVKKVPGSSVSGSLGKFGKVAGKLMALAVVVFILWLVRASFAGVQEPIITSFNMDAKKWADCQTIKASAGTYSQLNGDVDECNAIPDAGTSMWTSRVLSIIVKNMQSYIVTIVWGTAEMLAIFAMKGGKLRNGTSTKVTGTSPQKTYGNNSVAPSSGAVSCAVASSGVASSGGHY